MMEALKDPFEVEEESGEFLPVLKKAEDSALAQLGKIKELYEKTVEIRSIENNDQAVAVTGMKAAIQKLKKGYDGARKDAGAPLREALAKIQTFFEEGLGLLEKADTWIRGLQRNWMIKEEQSRRAQQAVVDKHVTEMQKEFDKQSAEMGFSPVTVAPLTVPKSSGPIRGADGSTTYMRTVWKYEVIDEKKVPREFCEHSDRLLRAAVDAGVRNIEGVRVWSEQIPITKTK
jgi:hypothetical protein